MRRMGHGMITTHPGFNLSSTAVSLVRHYALPPTFQTVAIIAWAKPSEGPGARVWWGSMVQKYLSGRR